MYDNRMAQIQKYWRANWDIIPLHAVGGNRSGKEPFGNHWQKRAWVGSELATFFWQHKRMNVGIRHGAPSKLCTIGIDFDGTEFMTYSNLLSQLHHHHYEELIDIFEQSALMQSSPDHHHLLVSIDKPIRKIIINYADGDKLEILGQGNQTVLPPSVCSKPEVYYNFERYWIDGRDTILHLSNKALEKFIKWVYNLCPSLPQEASQKFRLPQVKPKYTAKFYTGAVVMKDTSQFVETFFQALDFSGQGDHSFNEQFFAIILYLVSWNIHEPQIRAILDALIAKVNPIKDPHEVLDRVLRRGYHSKQKIKNLIRGYTI